MRTTLKTVALLAALVLGLAACGGGDDPAIGGDSPGGQTDGAGGGGTAAGGGGETLTFSGTDSLQFSEAPSSATAGTVTVELTAEGAVNHTVAFEGVNGGAPVVEAAGGETATGTVDLPAGTYTYFCTIAGHRDAGMEGTLTVS